MAKSDTKEACPKCASNNFAKSTDKSNRHYCNNCKNVWIPGLEVKMSQELKRLSQENAELKIEVSRLRAKIDAYKETAVEATELFD